MKSAGYGIAIKVYAATKVAPLWYGLQTTGLFKALS